MKTKSFRCGKFTCRSYLKGAGNGWEVGFTFNGKTCFVGNFVHSAEATRWYAIMNREVTSFSRRHKVIRDVSKNWYSHFIGKHLYRTYYKFCNKLFAKHNATYSKAVSREIRRYRTMNRRWDRNEKTTYVKAA